MAYSGKAGDAWTEKALVCIEEEGSTNGVMFRTMTSSIDPEFGEKGFESIPNLAGGRIVKFSPEEDSVISLDLYPIAAGNNWGTDESEGIGVFDLLHGKDSSYSPGGSPPDVYQKINNTHNRKRYRMTLMFTNDPNISDPRDAVSSAYAALRITMCGYFTKIDPEFDEVFKASVTFKAPAYTKSGSPNVQIESTDDGSVSSLPALGSFTSTNNF